MADELPSQLLGGRYLLGREFASGGMATVHLGQVVGAEGFARPVAIKRLRRLYARDVEFRAMLLDEARLTSRLRHANVVASLDAVADGDELLLVMEYVVGETLASLLRTSPDGIPVAIASAIVVDLLDGLHAAHVATGEAGEPLRIVHRDVSPQNVMIGDDGVARILDFGVAKAAGRARVTQQGEIRGKLAYMAPEQIWARDLDHRVDVFGAGVVLWETLVGRRLFVADHAAELARRITDEDVPPPSAFVATAPALDAVVLRALTKDRSDRFATAHDMAKALEHAVPPAPRRDVATWLRERAGEQLALSSARLTSLATQATARLPADVTAPLHASVPAPLSRPVTQPLRSLPPPRDRSWLVVAGLVALLLALGLAWWLSRGHGRRSRLPGDETHERRQERRRAQ